MRQWVSLATLAAAVLVPASVFGQSEPSQFICAVWPDRVLYFDQTTDEFTEAFKLRHGAITGNRATSDKKRLFVITDRMESVEVIDTVQRELVDTFKLSGAYRRVRIRSVSPNRDGTKVYLAVTVVHRGIDRFELEEGVDIIAYDVANDEVLDQFTLPPEVGASSRSQFHVAPDEKSFYIISKDIHQIDAGTREILDTMELSQPLLAGYGPWRGVNLTETEPGTFYGIYRTNDPIQDKRHFGVARLDLYDKRVSTFELGPELRLRHFALSPDGTKGYAGLHDMVVIDMERRKVLLKKEGFERGRTNLSVIVSHDGSKLYVSGVGDTMYVYDAATLEPLKTVFAGGDFMLPPVEIPSR